MIVGIDVDGVLFPWSDVANEAVTARFEVPDPGPHETWEHLKGRLTRPQWQWLWSADGQDTVFGQTSRIYTDVARVFNAILRSPDHDCHFVTHRDPRRAGVHTAVYLKNHFGGHPWAGLHVVQNGTPKHELAKWDVFVDDKPETVLDMLANTDAMVFAPARPWNTELAGLGHPRLVRYAYPGVILDVLGVGK